MANEPPSRCKDARDAPVGGHNALAEEDKKVLLIKPQARENVRALVGAAALGSTVGLAIGGAYLAGGLARATVVHAQIQRLAGAASGGFSDTALASAASGQDQAVLAIAKAHDPLAAATDDLKDRQVAALVDRLEARRAVRNDSAAGIKSPALAQNQKVQVQKSAQPQRGMVMKASLIQPKGAAAAEPFHLRGALDQSRDLECLTQAVYYEARGESKAGQQAVAQVILNRVRHPAFPKSICGVVFQGARTGGCQFSFACDGQPHHPVESAAWRRSEKIASDALDGQVMSEVGDATHFHVAGAGSGWNRLLKVAQIGAHVFYRFAGSAGSSAMFHREAEPSPSVQTHPVFASLGLGAGPSADASKLIESASAAVHRAATTLENAAKIGPSDQKPQPAVATKPQAAPGPAVLPADDVSKSAAPTPAA